jgi:hypothetical protein
MSIGINVSINVKDIDKARLVAAQNGKTYLNMTAWVNNEKGQYGDNGFISHEQTKEERESKTNTPILGNVSVFWDDSQTFQTRKEEQVPQAAPRVAPPMAGLDNLDEDLPF